MNNKYLMTVLILFSGLMPFYGQKFSAGITTGMNVSTLSEVGDIYNNSALKTGFGGGLALRYDLNESFSVKSGILYEQKGFRKRQESVSGNEKITGIYNYVTLPLMIEGSFVLTGESRFYGETGVYGGFKTYDENALSLSSDEIVSVIDNTEINEFDGGWIFGLGFQVPAGKHDLQIGFRYSLGLTEVMASSPDDRNKSVLFGATLFF